MSNKLLRIIFLLLLIPQTSALAGWFPHPFQCSNGQMDPTVIGFDTFTIDDVNDQAGYVFLAPKTGTISNVGFAISRYVLTAFKTIFVQIETVDAATGLPTGIPCGTSGSVLISSGIPFGLDNTWHQVTLGSGCSTTQGTPLAVVIGGNGTDDPAPGAIFIGQGIGSPGISYLLPYGVGNSNGGGWAKSDTNNASGLIGYDDGSYPNAGLYPYGKFLIPIFDSSDSPDEIGNILNPASDMQVLGAWVSVTSTSGDYDIVLYDSDETTELARIENDENVENTSTFIGHYVRLVYFSSPITLTGGSTYRITLRPSTTNTINMDNLTVDDADYMDSVLFGSVHRTERTDAGAWTETPTKRTCIGVIMSSPALSAVDESLNAWGWAQRP